MSQFNAVHVTVQRRYTCNVADKLNDGAKQTNVMIGSKGHEWDNPGRTEVQLEITMTLLYVLTSTSRGLHQTCCFLGELEGSELNSASCKGRGLMRGDRVKEGISLW